MQREKHHVRRYEEKSPLLQVDHPARGASSGGTGLPKKGFYHLRARTYVEAAGQGRLRFSISGRIVTTGVRPKIGIPPWKDLAYYN